MASYLAIISIYAYLSGYWSIGKRKCSILRFYVCSIWFWPRDWIIPNAECAIYTVYKTCSKSLLSIKCVEKTMHWCDFLGSFEGGFQVWKSHFWSVFLSILQRTCSHQVSPTLTWALSLKWWNALEQPPCSVLPVATLTQKSPGTKTSCPLTPVPVMGGSSSYAQVRKTGNHVSFSTFNSYF